MPSTKVQTNLMKIIYNTVRELTEDYELSQHNKVMEIAEKNNYGYVRKDNE